MRRRVLSALIVAAAVFAAVPGPVIADDGDDGDAHRDPIDRLVDSVSQLDGLTRRLERPGEPADPTLRTRVVEQADAAIAALDAALAPIQARAAGIDEDAPADEAERETLTRRDLLEYVRALASLDRGVATPDEAGRAGRLQAALAEIDAFLAARTVRFDLWCYAYRDRGRALAAGGRLEEARVVFDELTEVVPWHEPSDPDERRAVYAFCLEVATEASWLLARTSIADGAPEHAISAVDAMIARSRGGRDTTTKAPFVPVEHRFGRLAILERARALAALGRLDEAGAAVDAVAPRLANAERPPAIGELERHELAACETLADLAAISGEALPTRRQYWASVGLAVQGRVAASVWTVKGVLPGGSRRAMAAGDEPWVLAALVRLASALYHAGRPTESAIAYRHLYRAYPGTKEADDALRNARAAARRAVETLGEGEGPGPVRDLLESIEEDIISLGARSSDANALRLGNAVAAQRAGDFLVAAERYLEVLPGFARRDGGFDPAPAYPNAVANAGWCLYRHFAIDRESRAEHATRAIETLGRAIGIARERASDADEALARFYLGHVLIDPAIARALDAIAVLMPFQDRLADARVRGQATRELCRALLIRDELNRAASVVHDAAGSSVPADPALGTAAILVASAIADRAADSDRTAWDAGARLLLLWVDAVDPATRGTDERLWAGTVLRRGREPAAAASLLETLPAPATPPSAADLAAALELGWARLEAGDSTGADEALTPLLARLPADLRLLEGLARARLARWDALVATDRLGADRFVVADGGLLEVWAKLYRRLATVAPDDYRQLAVAERWSTRDGGTRRLEAFVVICRGKLARQDYLGCERTISLHDQQGNTDDVVTLRDARTVTGRIIRLDAAGMDLRTWTGMRTLTAEEIERVADHRAIRDELRALRDRARRAGGGSGR